MILVFEIPDSWNNRFYFGKVKSLTDQNVYIAMVMKSDKETMLFHSYLESRQAIANELELSEITVRNSMVRLVDAGLIVKVKKGIYKINPAYIKFMGKKIRKV